MARVLVVLCRLVQEPPQLAVHDSVRVRTAFPQLGLQPPQPLYVYAGLCGEHVGETDGEGVGDGVGEDVGSVSHSAVIPYG